MSTGDGGVQLRLQATARRRLVELRVGADDPDDLARVAASLARLGVAAERTDTGLRTYDPGTEVTVVVEIADRGWRDALRSDPVLALGLNTFDGVVTYPSVADAHGLPAASLEAVLA